MLCAAVEGEVPERSNGAVSKTVVPSRAPRVRIPVSPPTGLRLPAIGAAPHQNLMFPKMRRFRRAPEQCNAAIIFNPSALSAPDSYADRIWRPSRSNVAPFRFHLPARTKPDSRSGGQAAPNMKLPKHPLSDNGKSSFRMRSMQKPGMSSFRGGAYAIEWTYWNGDF